MKNLTTARILQFAGVLVLGLLAWRRMAARGGPVWPSVLLTLALVAVIAAGVWWWSRRDDGVRQQAVAVRPGWHTQAVWADSTLGGALSQLGATAGKVRGGTRLTFAWSASEVQLWRGEAVATTLPWEQVATITRTIGHAASTGNPAVELVTRQSVRIVVVPTRRPDGGMLPAGAAAVEALVDELRDAQQAAVSATGRESGAM